MITRSGSLAASKGPAETFTGDVVVQPLFAAEETAAYTGATRRPPPDPDGISPPRARHRP
jgi:hypothetical protein